MAKKIELLHTTYDESGNIESQEVVHPLTSPDCIIMENGKTLDEVMGDGIATPTLTHEGTSFKVGVGDSNIEVVDGDVAGMTLKGQSYQNILPKPTTLIMETDEKEFKINDKIDSNIIIDDNIAEIATVKGKTIVNAVQEGSASEYTVLSEDLNGQSIVTTNKPEGNIKGVTLQGQTLVNTIQEPCKDDYVVLGADDGIEISAETGGYGTIEDTVQGGINGVVLEGMTLVNLAQTKFGTSGSKANIIRTDIENGMTYTIPSEPSGYITIRTFAHELLKPSTTYTILFEIVENTIQDYNGVTVCGTEDSYFSRDENQLYHNSAFDLSVGKKRLVVTTHKDISAYDGFGFGFPGFPRSGKEDSGGKLTIKNVMIIEGDHSNKDIPYFEGMKSVQMPVLKTTGKNLFDIEKVANINNWVCNKTSSTNPYHYYEFSLKPNTTYTFSRKSDIRADGIYAAFNTVYGVYYEGGGLIHPSNNGANKSTVSFTTDSNGKIFLNVYNIKSYLSTFISLIEEAQIEEGSTATPYEPYKSNILTVNEEVELRGIGDIKDELDLQTGELTQRIGETVLDGSEEWGVNNSDNEGFYSCSTTTYVGEPNGKVICDKLPSITTTKFEGVMMGITTGKLMVSFDRDKTGVTSLTTFKKKLAELQLKVCYELATPIIKTIDLTVTDQDGNTIPHIQTQPTVTHITASSDYLIPTVTIDNNLAYDTIIKPSTLYTVRFKHDTVNADNPLTVDLGGTTQTVTATEFTITTPSTLTHNQLVFSGKNNVVSKVQVIEGDVTNIEYPFFEGMSDVKFSDSKFIARGKNLLHVGKGYSTTSNYNGLTVIRNEVDQTITVDGTCTLDNTSCALAPFYCEFKKGERYALSCKLISGTADKILFRVNDQGWKDNISCGIKATSSNIYETCIKIFYSDETYDRSSIRVDSGATFNNAVFKVMLEKIPVSGDYTPQYEPYKGVEVQQDVDSIPLTSDMFEQGAISSGKIFGMSYQQFTHTNTITNRIKSKTLIPVKPNSRLTITNFNMTTMKFWGWEFDKNGAYIKQMGDYNGTEYIISSNTYYIAVIVCYTDDSTISPSDLNSMNLILQEVPQEIVLRGIGNVKDELDLTRGEYIQRIGEVVLDGSNDEGWELMFAASVYGNPIYGTKSNYINSSDYVELVFKNDRIALQGAAQIINTNVEEAIYINTWENTGIIGIKIGLDFNDFKQYLSQNPVKVQYQLETPIIHKVNLTNTKVIPSYATETHYETITPSDSLIPNIIIPSTLNYDVAIKPSTQYTIRANTSDNLTVDLGGTIGTLSNGKVTLTTPATLTHNEVKFSGTGKVKELMVVEGNEIKDNVPFFNGMKNVEMGGIKLVNIARGATCNSLVTANTNKTQFTYTSNGSGSWGSVMFDKALLKPSTTYTLYMNIKTNTSDNRIKVQLGNGNEGFLNISAGTTGLIKQTITTAKDLPVNMSINYVHSSVSGKQVVIENPMIIEGDWTHLDEIPFIESEMIIDQPIIRSQGKNLLDLETKYFNPSNVTYTKSGTTYTVVGNTSNYNYGQFAWTTETSAWFRNLLGKEVTLSVSSISCTNANSKACIQVRMECTDGSKVYRTISTNEDANSETFTIPSNAIDMALQLMSNNTGSPLDGESTLTVSNIQLELGNTATPYEPYKHQTLYSNRVIGYEEGCYYSSSTGVKIANGSYTTVLADVDGLEVAYVTSGSSNYTFFDKDGVFISGRSYPNTATTDNQNGFIIAPSNAKYMRFACGNVNDNYTPYTKATVTGDLPLRSLPNGVCDTLNLVTGEYVQRVGEVVLDGSEDWTQHTASSLEKTHCFATKLPYKGSLQYNTLLWTDKISNHSVGWTNDVERIWINEFDRVTLHLFKNKCNSMNGFKQYLSQNPITVQYELATPIVRKLGFTTKGNYTEFTMDETKTWRKIDKASDNFIVSRYTCHSNRDYKVGNIAWVDNLDFISKNMDGEGYDNITSNFCYIMIDENKLSEDTIDGFKQWLSQNPIKASYLTNQQSSDSYSNIHKPIFFNNVVVQFLPNNLDIQPQLTLQARTTNSYVMDMMKANTKYSLKLLTSSGNMKIDGISYTLANNRTFISPSTLTNKELIILGQWYEPMIIEGDITGKNLPYFKGILSSYHDVDEIELYSVTNNILDESTVEYGTLYINSGLDNPNIVTNRRRYGYFKCEPNTAYYFYTNYGEPACNWHAYDENKKWICALGFARNIVTPSNCKYLRIYMGNTENQPLHEFKSCVVKQNSIITYIPHAHNTTLIEMPTRLETVKIVRPVLENGAINTGTGVSYDDGDALVRNVRTKDYLPVQPGEIIKFYNNGQGRAVNIHYYDINKQFIGFEYYNGTSTTPTVPKDCYFVRMYCGKSACSDITLTRQAYKPIQLNSLPNGVCDEIIMKPNSNKAQLVQRVGKVVLDGSEDIGIDSIVMTSDYTLNEISTYFRVNPTPFTLQKAPASYSGQPNMLCDSLVATSRQESQQTISNSICVYNDGFGMRPKNDVNSTISLQTHLQQNPITVYYELTTPIIHEIQLKGYPTVYKYGAITLNTDISHKTLVSYNVNQEQLISIQNETIIRHDQQIDDLYYYIEMYLEEIYQMELFRMKLELSL